MEHVILLFFEQKKKIQFVPVSKSSGLVAVARGRRGRRRREGPPGACREEGGEHVPVGAHTWLIQVTLVSPAFIYYAPDTLIRFAYFEAKFVLNDRVGF